MHNSTRMPSKTGKGGHYNNIPTTHYGPNPTDTSGLGKNAPNPHPNGGETREMDRASMEPKMPQRMKVTPITHGTVGMANGKMPRRMGGGQERDPFRR